MYMIKPGISMIMRLPVFLLEKYGCHFGDIIFRLCLDNHLNTTWHSQFIPMPVKMMTTLAAISLIMPAASSPSPIRPVRKVFAQCIIPFIFVRFLEIYSTTMRHSLESVCIFVEYGC